MTEMSMKLGLAIAAAVEEECTALMDEGCFGDVLELTMQVRALARALSMIGESIQECAAQP